MNFQHHFLKSLSLTSYKKWKLRIPRIGFTYCYNILSIWYSVAAIVKKTSPSGGRRKWLLVARTGKTQTFLSHRTIHTFLWSFPKLWSKPGLGKIGGEQGKPQDVHQSTIMLWETRGENASQQHQTQGKFPVWKWPFFGLSYCDWNLTPLKQNSQILINVLV